MSAKRNPALDIDSRPERPISVPPLQHTLVTGNSPTNRPGSVPVEGRTRMSSGTPTTNGNSLDLMGHLQRAGQSVVKTRTGSVLSRGFILKTDFYPSGVSHAFADNVSDLSI